MPSYDVSTKPYLLRAIYEWCVDQGHTPYIAVQVDAQTRVPVEFVKDGQIVLNISYTATRHLKIENETIHFSARFNGTSRELEIPVTAVIGIFSKENGQGMFFQPGADTASSSSQPATDGAPAAGNAPAGSDDGPTPSKPPRGGHLKVVK